MTDSQPPATPGPLSEDDARTQAKLAHIINGFIPFVGGLVMWLIGKERSDFVDDQGKEATNFGIVVVLGWIILWIGGIVLGTVGPDFLGTLCWLAQLALWVFSFIMGINAGQAAGEGTRYRYSFLPVRIIN
ncbi:DUF4870 domain-containing protein [Demequina sp.]|uniref:DUF4870 domain-containing protein n=1 Tax=Demequina sp. TaxID=2050685 RepID=UPI003D132B83